MATCLEAVGQRGKQQEGTREIASRNQWSCAFRKVGRKECAIARAVSEWEFPVVEHDAKAVRMTAGDRSWRIIEAATEAEQV